MHKRSIGKVIASAAFKNKLMMLALIIVIAASILLQLTPPLVLERAVNMLTGQLAIPVTLALAYFLLSAVSGLADSFKEWMITKTGQKITHEVRSAMAEKMTLLPASYFSRQESGSIVSLFVNDVDALERLFTSGIISMMTDVFKVISILVVVFIKSKGLGILLILVTPVLFLLTRVVQKNMLSAQLDNRAAIAKANKHIPETLKNIRTIRLYRKERYMEKKYGAYIDESFDAMERSNFYDAVYSPIIITISAVIVSVMMILASINGGMMRGFGLSVGTAVAIIAYVGKVFDPLESIGMEIQNIQSALAGLKRVSAFMKEEERTPGTRDDFDYDADAVVADHVTFGYEPGKTVLRDFGCDIETGENITLFGRTGAGKSTFLKLLLNLYEPGEGSIRVFNVPTGEIADDAKRRLFGYVEQSFSPVEGSVMDQITLRDEGISREQAERALAMVGMLEAVEQLPEKGDTPYSAELFSQGQNQLLSIARAIVMEPRILLLDEITANLDSHTEGLVMQALSAAAEDRTVVSVSHRLYAQRQTRRIEIPTERKAEAQA